METLKKGTEPEPRKTIIVEDKDNKKTSFEEEMRLYICKQNF